MAHYVPPWSKEGTEGLSHLPEDEPLTLAGLRDFGLGAARLWSLKPLYYTVPRRVGTRWGEEPAPPRLHEASMRLPVQNAHSRHLVSFGGWDDVFTV